MTGYDHLKRGLDIAIAAPALVLSAQVQAASAIAVRRQLGSPVLFRHSPVLFHQRRPGLHGKLLTLLKFRSMRTPRFPDEPDAERMTCFGTLLRSTSPDEFPSLVNVLREDMSIVGPRPLIMKYLELYSPEQFRRHEVHPGVTGLAHVSGRNATSWDVRCAHDVDYVERRTLGLDAEIVLRRDGISAVGEATMARFTGSNSEAGTDAGNWA